METRKNQSRTGKKRSTTRKASPSGHQKIQQAIEKINRENGWIQDSPRWLDEAIKHLPKIQQGGKEVPDTVSLGTWKRFRTNDPIGVGVKYFKAFCLVLGLDWQEVVENSPHQD